MSTFWHRVGVYFGLAKQTPEERAAAAEHREPISLSRRVVAGVVGLGVGGLVIGLLDQSVLAGVSWALSVGAVFLALDLYKWFQRSK